MFVVDSSQSSLKIDCHQTMPGTGPSLCLLRLRVDSRRLSCPGVSVPPRCQHLALILSAISAANLKGSMINSLGSCIIDLLSRIALISWCSTAKGRNPVSTASAPTALILAMHAVPTLAPAAPRLLITDTPPTLFPIGNCRTVEVFQSIFLVLMLS